MVRHILVTPNEIIDDETAKQRLEDALEKIADGEEFGEIAKLLSDDPGSANMAAKWIGRVQALSCLNSRKSSTRGNR